MCIPETALIQAFCLGSFFFRFGDRVGAQGEGVGRERLAQAFLIPHDQRG